MPAHGSCDGCVLREGYLNARLHDGGPFRHSTHKRWVGLYTDGSVKLFASHRDAAPASTTERLLPPHEQSAGQREQERGPQKCKLVRSVRSLMMHRILRRGKGEGSL